MSWAGSEGFGPNSRRQLGGKPALGERWPCCYLSEDERLRKGCPPIRSAKAGGAIRSRVLIPRARSCLGLAFRRSRHKIRVSRPKVRSRRYHGPVQVKERRYAKRASNIVLCARPRGCYWDRRAGR